MHKSRCKGVRVRLFVQDGSEMYFVRGWDTLFCNTVRKGYKES